MKYLYLKTFICTNYWGGGPSYGELLNPTGIIGGPGPGLPTGLYNAQISNVERGENMLTIQLKNGVEVKMFVWLSENCNFCLGDN